MRRDINFFSVYRSQINVESQDKFKVAALSICVGSLIVVLGIFSYFKYSDLSAQNSMLSASSFLQSPQLAQAQQKIADGSSKITALNAYLKAAKSVSGGISQLPHPDSKLLEKVASLEPDDVTVTSLSFSDQSLTLSCTCKDNTTPAVFVHALEQSGNFIYVNYEGISSGNGSTFSFDVVITLKGGYVK